MKCPPIHIFWWRVICHEVSSPSRFCFFGDWIFFMATILQLKVARRWLFEKVSLERCELFQHLIVRSPGLENNMYLNSSLPYGQVTVKYCLPGTLLHLPKFLNSLIIHELNNSRNKHSIIVERTLIMANFDHVWTHATQSTKQRFAIFAKIHLNIFLAPKIYSFQTHYQKFSWWKACLDSCPWDKWGEKVTCLRGRKRGF